MNRDQLLLIRNTAIKVDDGSSFLWPISTSLVWLRPLVAGVIITAAKAEIRRLANEPQGVPQNSNESPFQWPANDVIKLISAAFSLSLSLECLSCCIGDCQTKFIRFSPWNKGVHWSKVYFFRWKSADIEVRLNIFFTNVQRCWWTHKIFSRYVLSSTWLHIRQGALELIVMPAWCCWIALIGFISSFLLICCASTVVKSIQRLHRVFFILKINWMLSGDFLSGSDEINGYIQQVVRLA